MHEEQGKIFWKTDDVGATISRPPQKENQVGATIGRLQTEYLNENGKLVEKAIKNISNVYPMVVVEIYAIMPNHIHLLLRICPDEYGRPMVAPTISNVVKQMKGYVTKQIGKAVWQKLFHDRVVRNRDEFYEIAKYINENPSNWEKDCFYTM